MPARPSKGEGRARSYGVPLEWGRLTESFRRGATMPEVSRLHKAAAGGPVVNDEYLYTVVDALDKVAAETARPSPRSPSTGYCNGLPSQRHHRARTRSSSRQPRIGRLEPDTGADRNLDRRPAKPMPHIPTGHQQSVSTERNPLPVTSLSIYIAGSRTSTRIPEHQSRGKEKHGFHRWTRIRSVNIRENPGYSLKQGLRLRLRMNRFYRCTRNKLSG